MTETIRPTRDEPEETWEEKEDKQDVENIKPDGIKLSDQKYQYKEGELSAINTKMQSLLLFCNSILLNGNRILTIANCSMK